MEKSNLKKSFIWNTIGTTLSSFNSLFFMIIVTRINGISDAGIFTFAFSLACLFYVIGAYSGRAYQVTENNNNISDTDYFYSKIITCFFMILISMIYCIINGYSLYKISIIMLLTLFKMLEAFSEFSYAILQKNDKLYKVGKSLTFKSILSLLLFLLVDIATKNIIISELVIVVVNIFFILFYDYINLKQIKFKVLKYNKKNIVELLLKGFYTFGFTFLTVYVINASKYALDGLLSYNLQTVFGIILMPATILSLFAQFIIQPFVLQLKVLLKSNLSKFKNLNIKLIISIVVIGILAMTFIYFLGIPILNLLYGIDLTKYLSHLMIIMIGAIFYSLTIVFTTSLTTMRYTFNQLIIYSITSIVAFFLSKILIVKYSIMGAAISYLLSMTILLVLYILIYLISLKKIKEDHNG